MATAEDEQNEDAEVIPSRRARLTVSSATCRKWKTSRWNGNSDPNSHGVMAEHCLANDCLGTRRLDRRLCLSACWEVHGVKDAENLIQISYNLPNHSLLVRNGTLESMASFIVRRPLMVCDPGCSGQDDAFEVRASRFLHREKEVHLQCRSVSC